MLGIKLQAYKKFCMFMIALEVTITGNYTNTATFVDCLCPNKHPIKIRPSYITADTTHVQCKHCPKIKNRTKKQIEEDFREIFTRLRGTIIGAYISGSQTIHCKCPKGHQIYIKPNEVTKNHIPCIQCSGQCPQQAEERFKKKILALGGSMIGKYVNNTTTIECKCNQNHTIFLTPGNFRGDHIPCMICHKMTQTESKNRFYETISRLGGIVIGTYMNCYTRVQCKCSKGHTTYVRSTHLIDHIPCRKCLGNCPIDAEKRFYTTLLRLGGQIMGRYINKRLNVDCKCSKGHTVNIRPDTLKDHIPCSKCAGTSPIDAKNNFFNTIFNFGGQVIGMYKNIKTPVMCICPSGHTTYPTPSNIRNGGGMCRKCSRSKGEKLIANVLDKMGIIFETEVYHPLLKKLRYDFRFIYNNITIYIEYDGLQHQKENAFFHRKPESFTNARQRDLLKNHVCKYSANTILIRLDHRWITDKSSTDERLIQYITQCINSKQGVIAYPDMYTWINDLPFQETYNEYIKTSEIQEEEKEESDNDNEDIIEEDEDENEDEYENEYWEEDEEDDNEIEEILLDN